MTLAPFNVLHAFCARPPDPYEAGLSAFTQLIRRECGSTPTTEKIIEFMEVNGGLQIIKKLFFKSSEYCISYQAP